MDAQDDTSGRMDARSPSTCGDELPTVPAIQRVTLRLAGCAARDPLHELQHVRLRLAGSTSGPSDMKGMHERPARGDRFFVPHKLFFRAKSTATTHGPGWEATVLQSDSRTCQFWCDGDTTPSVVPLVQFVRACTRLHRSLPSVTRLKDDDGTIGTCAATGIMRDDLEQRGYVVLNNVLSRSLTEGERDAFHASPYWRVVRDGAAQERGSHDLSTNYSGLRHSLPVDLPEIRAEILKALASHSLLQDRDIAPPHCSMEEPPDRAYAEGLTLLRSDPGAPEQHHHADRGCLRILSLG